MLLQKNIMDYEYIPYKLRFKSMFYVMITVLKIWYYFNIKIELKKTIEKIAKKL